MLLIFIFFLLLTAGGAIVVLLTSDLIYAAFGLLTTLLGIAALYVLAGADVPAVTQLLVYVGGILVLLVFGVMLTRNRRAASGLEANRVLTGHRNRFTALLAAGGVFGLLTLVLSRAGFERAEAAHFDVINRKSGIYDVGIGLMTSHLLPFEVAGVLLLVGLAGAAYLASQHLTSPEKL